jgi:hypothetical protein
VTVGDVIQHLGQFDPEMEIKLEIYAGGNTGFEEITPDMIVEVSPRKKADKPLVKIDAVYN